MTFNKTLEIIRKLRMAYVYRILNEAGISFKFLRTINDEKIALKIVNITLKEKGEKIKIKRKTLEEFLNMSEEKLHEIGECLKKVKQS